MDLEQIQRMPARPLYTGERYYTEFEELAKIGAGSFGKVYRVLKKDKGTHHAIKKLDFKSTNRQKISEEMWIHAELDHPNVVPYEDGWFEFNGDSETTASEESSSSDGKDRNSEPSDSVFNQTQLQSSLHAGIGVDVAIAHGENNNVSASASGNGKLYIQMALREQTLGHWLEVQINIPPPQVIKEILIEIFKGLYYIHSRNIVHHDVKPANILVSRAGRLIVELADFGLACRFAGNQPNKEHSPKGTPGFIAPEQLRGECNIQSDVYSAGIVLLGLLIPMQMEQADALKILKKGRVPSHLPAGYLSLFQVVSLLVQENPGIRPTTGDVLNVLTTE